VAKSRKGGRKASSSARRPARGGAKKRATKKTRAAKPARRLEFQELRTQLEQAVAALGRKKARAVDGGARLDDAQRRIERWMADIDDFCTEEMQDICGPTMALELASA
jgi:hypothetical protein